MTFLDSSIVLRPKPSKLFHNSDPDDAKFKTYPTEISLIFNPDKLTFQVNTKQHLITNLQKQVIEYCDKNKIYENLQSISINFLTANIKTTYENICKKLNIQSDKLPQFQNKTPNLSNIVLQYKISDNESVNFKIHRAEDKQQTQPPIPVFDTNAHYNLNETNKDSVQKIIDKLPSIYDQVTKFIENI